MKHKRLLLALAVSAALFALPEIAAAAEWDIDSESGALPKITLGGGAAELTASGFGAFLPIKCTSSGGFGSGYTSQTTAELHLEFTGCRQGSNECHTVGQFSETILTTNLVSHNVMIHNTFQVAGGTPGLLLTPNAEHFASFTCSGSNYVIKGNGIIADISSPKCGGAFSKSATVQFQAIGSGVVRYPQVETSGTSYGLSTTTPLGTFSTALAVTMTWTFNQGTKMTCP
jgi:hypothetical protein